MKIKNFEINLKTVFIVYGIYFIIALTSHLLDFFPFEITFHRNFFPNFFYIGTAFIDLSSTGQLSIIDSILININLSDFIMVVFLVVVIPKFFKFLKKKEEEAIDFTKLNEQELNSKIRSVVVAYVVALVFPLAGFHYAYLSQWRKFIIFAITFGGVAIWNLIDMFLIPSKIRTFNSRIYVELDKFKKEKEAKEKTDRKEEFAQQLKQMKQEDEK